MKLSKNLFLLSIIVLLIACNKDETIQPGDDPNFTIIANDDDVLCNFNRKVEVFGVKIFAVPDVEDAKLLHAANVMAQYLDNDEDGQADNQAVVDRMVEENAFVVIWKKQRDIKKNPNGWHGQDLGNDETHPSFVADGKMGTFDASLEEILHIITSLGYASVYPDVFGESIGSEIANAMDIARGGQFTSIPNNYPANAWYSYDDRTCDYGCMVTEYTYWALTSMLGAQENRLNEIEQEWKLNTRAKVEQTDLAVFQLLTDPLYAFPTVLPDGTYMR